MSRESVELFKRVTTNFITNTMKKELQVNGMKCSNCELLVTEALEDLEGIIEVEASQLTGIVAVDYDPKMVSVTTITAVIEAQGFKVKS